MFRDQPIYHIKMRGLGAMLMELDDRMKFM